MPIHAEGRAGRREALASFVFVPGLRRPYTNILSWGGGRQAVVPGPLGALSSCHKGAKECAIGT